MPKPRYVPEKPAKLGSYGIILSWLGKDQIILDVGCSSGYLGTWSKANHFYGIELDRESGQEAKKKYQKVFIGDVEKLNRAPFPGEKFDIVIFADILEHLVFPEKTLSFLVKNSLARNGKVIISLPNVARITVRLKLLLGRFDYTEGGVLDKTHLHLYTLKSAKQLIANCGLEIEKVRFGSEILGRIYQRLPFLGTFLSFNLIFLCRKKRNGARGSVFQVGGKAEILNF